MNEFARRALPGCRVAPRIMTMLVATLLAACSGLSSTESAAVTYQLRAAPPDAVANNTATNGPAAGNPLRPFSLRVLQPIAAPGLDSDAIMLTGADRKLDHYAASRWAAPSALLLANLAVESLRNRAVLGAVHDEGAPYQSDYLLRISIRRFDADYGTDSSSAPVATVVLDCTVGTRSERKLLASFVAQGSAQAAANRMSEVVAAFERAVQAALASANDQTFAALAGDVAQ